MTLLDTLLQINRDAAGAMQLTDMAIGTVASVNPLAITLDTSQAVIRRELLYLTPGVIEKKLSYLGHTHSVSGGTSGEALSSVVCTENGEALPAGENGIILNRALETGDKVLLLSVQHGQKFIVLGRLY